MNMKEKIISYGRKHPKDKNIIIAMLAIIIFAENIKKACKAFLTGAAKTVKLRMTGEGSMYEYDEKSKGYNTSVRNVEYNSEKVKKQFRGLNYGAVLPVGLVCLTAVYMTGIAGKMNLPKKVSASEIQVNTEAKEIKEEEEVIVTKNESIQTTSNGYEKIVIDNSKLPWYLFLVNDEYPVTEDYQVELESAGGGKLVDSRIAEPLEDMLKAAKEAGMNCRICSAYRTAAKQESLVKKDAAKYKAKGYSEEEALELTYLGVSPVGHSEHQTGLTVDIVSASHQTLDAAHADTKEAIWLKEHCKEYGFIVRYMEGKEEITHRKAESWHFRYVGVEAAAYIMENGITLEEYLEEYIKNNQIGG